MLFFISGMKTATISAKPRISSMRPMMVELRIRSEYPVATRTIAVNPAMT